MSLSRRIGLEARELRKAMWLGAVLMAITASYTLVKTARDSLFLSRLPAASLPWVYIVVGVVTLVASMAIERITRDRSPLGSLLGTLTGAALGLAGFTALAGLRASWLPVGFYLYVNAYGLVLVSQFWVYANSSSDPRQMKRICGIVGGAGILGGLVGGVLATVLAEGVDLRWSIAAGAGLLAVCVPPLTRAIGREERQTRADPVQPAIESPPTPLLRTPYVRWLALSTLCSVIVTGLLDYQLKVAVQHAHPAAAELGSFFGRFYTAMNVVALMIQLFATRALLQWLGAGSAAAVLPAGLALGSGAMLLAPGFPAVLGTRLWDQIARFSVNKSAVELLFFPLPPGLKRRAKAFIGAGIERVGDALAGVLILAASMWVPDTPMTMPLLIGALVVVWLVACVRVRHGYVRELGRNLARMTLEPDREPVSLREWSILKETVRMLESPYERVALQAIDLLEQNAAPLLDARLPALMDHPSARVRARALERAIDSPAPADHQRVAALVHDRDPMVRLLALRASCAVGPGSPLAALDEYLVAEDPEMRATALICLVEHASGDAHAQVRTRLERTLADGSRDDRVAVVAALGALAQPTALDALLAPLLGDADVKVRRATLRAVGHAGLVEHVPALIAALAARETEDAAREGLVALGEPIVESLAVVLLDAAAPIEVRRVIPRVLGDLPNQSSVHALFGVRTRDDVMLSYRLLKAANRLRLTNPALAFPRESIEEDLEYDVGEFLLAELHVESQMKPDDSETAREGDSARAEAFLVLVLRERMAQAFNRVFRRLGLLYSPTEMLSAYLGTLSEYPRVRAHAVEYIEGALTPEHRALVEPLLPGAKREPRRELSATRYGLTSKSADESLALLLDGDDLWLRSCALYVIGSRKQQSLAAQVAMNLECADARVRETAQWATAALAGGRS